MEFAVVCGGKEEEVARLLNVDTVRHHWTFSILLSRRPLLPIHKMNCWTILLRNITAAWNL